jgi:hypothetical protein
MREVTLVADSSASLETLARFRSSSLFSETCAMGSPKVPGIMVFHCNGSAYGNACLPSFTVGPLRTHTLALPILPLLEAPAEDFFRKSAFAFHLIFPMALNVSL